MSRVNEPALHEYCRTRCVLEDIQLAPLLHASTWETLKTLEGQLDTIRKVLRSFLSGSEKYLVAGGLPTPQRIIIWICVEVDGYEQIARVLLRSFHPTAQGDELVHITSQDSIEAAHLQLMIKSDAYRQRELLFRYASSSSS